MDASIPEDIERTARILDALPRVVREEAERGFPGVPYTCVYNARVGFDVLRHFGIRVRALPVSVTVVNPAMVARMQREPGWPANQDEMREWQQEDGSWGVQVGDVGYRPGRYDGHLVLLALGPDLDGDPDYGGVLVDAAIHQVSRPQHNIELESVVTPVSPNLLRDESQIVSNNGCALIYRRIDNVGYIDAPDWRDKERRVFAVERCIARLSPESNPGEEV